MSATKSSLNLRQGSSHRQTRISLFAGFGGLLLLMSHMGLSAISSMYRHGLDKKKQIEARLGDRQKLLTPGSQEPFARFSEEPRAWFGVLSPVLEWDAQSRKQRGYQFMQEKVLPMRSLVLDSADHLQQLAEQDLERSSEDIRATVAGLRTQLMMLTSFAVFIGLALAGVALWRLLRLESESMLRFLAVLRTREELERLSAELLSAQETECRRIWRELHDEVRQVLSAIAFGLGNARSAPKDGRREEVFADLDQLLEMIERTCALSG